MSLTTDPTDPRLTKGIDHTPRPQAEVYLVLSEEERAKGFIRPYRDSYKHIGKRPKYPLRELTVEERERHGNNYTHYEQYPESESPLTGRYWTEVDLNSGCGAVTTMGRVLSETYARNPSFYGATYCTGCNMHKPIEEFVWTLDGAQLGT